MSANNSSDINNNNNTYLSERKKLFKFIEQK